MKLLIKNILKFIVDSNIWIALATALFYALSFIQLNLSVPLNATIVFLFSSALFTYTLFQILDKNVTASLFSKLIVLLSFLVQLACIPFLSFTTLIILILSGLLTFFYATPLISFGKNSFNLRKIWFLKSIIVALVWMLSCAVIPLLEMNASTHDLYLFSLEKFLFILGITIPYDIKDIKSDTAEKGMTSFVMKFGIQKTIWLSNLILLFAMLFAIYLYPTYIIAVLVSYGFAIALNFSLKENTKIYWFTFLIDASIIIYFLSFYLSRILR